jgi:thiamine biosynthesis protein ThiC
MSNIQFEVVIMTIIKNKINANVGWSEVVVLATWEVENGRVAD